MPLILLFLVCEPGLSSARPGVAAAEAYRYHPKLRPPPSLESIYQHMAPGKDAFPAEKEAGELAARLEELGANLRDSPGRVPQATESLLAPEFKGGRLAPATEVSLGSSPHLEIFRAAAMPADLVKDRASFPGELLALVDEFQAIRVAEFLITAIDVPQQQDPLVRTVVRFDIVGTGKKSWRAERLGQWQMRWRRGADGVWRVVEWITLDQLRSLVKHQYSIRLPSSPERPPVTEGTVTTGRDGEIQVLTSEEEAYRISRELLERGVRFSVNRISLDDVFFHLVGSTGVPRQ